MPGARAALARASRALRLNAACCVDVGPRADVAPRGSSCLFS